MAEPDPKVIKRGLYFFGIGLGLPMFFFGLMMFLDELWMDTLTRRRGSQQFVESGMKAAYNWILNSVGPQVGGAALMVLAVLIFGIFFRVARKMKT